MTVLAAGDDHHPVFLVHGTTQRVNLTKSSVEKRLKANRFLQSAPLTTAASALCTSDTCDEHR